MSLANGVHDPFGSSAYESVTERFDITEAFRQGSGGVAQDLRLLTRPWGFGLGEVGVPTEIHHGSVDTTVPLDHARRFAASIPHARLQIYPGHGHFSIPARSAWFSDRRV